MILRLSAALFCVIFSTAPVRAAAPVEEVVAALTKAMAFLQPGPASPARALHLSGHVAEATGGAAVLQGGTFDLQLEPPRHLRLRFTAAKFEATLCQNDQQFWIHVPQKNLLIIGDAAVPRFSTRPDSVEPVQLDLFRLPVSRTQLLLLPALVSVAAEPAADGTAYSLTPAPARPLWIFPSNSPG